MRIQPVSEQAVLSAQMTFNAIRMEAIAYKTKLAGMENRINTLEKEIEELAKNIEELEKGKMVLINADMSGLEKQLQEKFEDLEVPAGPDPEAKGEPENKFPEKYQVLVDKEAELDKEVAKQLG